MLKLFLLSFFTPTLASAPISGVTGGVGWVSGLGVSGVLALVSFTVITNSSLSFIVPSAPRRSLLPFLAT